MIDVHAHILPGIDDGPADLAGAVALGRAAAAAGTRLLVATPHVREDHPAVNPLALAGACRSLERELERQGIDLVLVPGGEVDLAWAVHAETALLDIVSYGQRGSDLLIETPHGPLGEMFEDVLWSIVARGYRVTLAHPERNPTFQAHPERLLRLVDHGVLTQITGMSLTTTRRGSRSRRLARLLIERRAAHLIASDAHAATGVRGPDLRDAFRAAAALDPVRAEWMRTEVPAALLSSEPLEAPPRSRPRRRLLRRPF